MVLFNLILDTLDFLYAFVKLIISNTMDAIAETLHYIISSTAVTFTIKVFSATKCYFSQMVASRDVRALFNEFNVSLTIVYCVLTT